MGSLLQGVLGGFHCIQNEDCATGFAELSHSRCLRETLWRRNVPTTVTPGERAHVRATRVDDILARRATHLCAPRVSWPQSGGKGSFWMKAAGEGESEGGDEE